MPNDRVRETKLIQLLDAVYEAAFEPVRWERVLQEATELYGTRSGKMGSVDFATGGSMTWALRGIDPEVHDLWEAEFADQDVWAREGLAKLAREPGRRTLVGAEVVAPDELRRTPVYWEILRQCHVQDVLSTILAWSDTTLGWLAVYRGPGDAPFDPAERDLHDWIGRHARRAFALGALLRSEQSRSRAILERLPCAAFLCEADGRVVAHNGLGEALAHGGDGLAIRNGRLRARHAADQDALARALALATGSAVGRSLAGGSTLRVRRAPGRAPLSLFADPLPPDGLAAERFAEPFTLPAALVLVSDPESRTLLPETALAAAFGLTPAESRLLAALCAGEAPADYADRQQISRETARFHVKQLLAKTGARRQADLVRIALESVVRLASAGRREEENGG